MAIRKNFQLLAAQETQPGSQVANATLFTATYATIQTVGVPELSYNQEQNTREIIRGTLSPSAPAAGATEATLSFSCELGGVSSGLPPWSLPLQACGVYNATYTRIAIGAVTGGPFYAGETITGGTSAATATVVHDVYDGFAFMRMTGISGAWVSGEVATGGTSGATATTSSTAALVGTHWRANSQPTMSFDYDGLTGTIGAGHTLVGQTSGAVITPTATASGATGTLTFRLLDGTIAADETFVNETVTGQLDDDNSGSIQQLEIPTLTLAVIEDGRAKIMRGARGNFRINAQIGQVPTIAFEFKGLVVDPIDRAQVTDVTYTSIRGPSFLGADVRLGNVFTSNPALSAEVTPALRSISYDHGNDVQTRRDATQATGIFDSAHLVNRSATGAIDIDIKPEATFSTIQDFLDADAWRIRAEIGSAARNMFRITLPYLVTSGLSGNENNGFAGNEISFSAGSNTPNAAEANNREFSMSFVTNDDTGDW